MNNNIYIGRELSPENNDLFNSLMVQQRFGKSISKFIAIAINVLSFDGWPQYKAFDYAINIFPEVGQQISHARFEPLYQLSFNGATLDFAANNLTFTACGCSAMLCIWYSLFHSLPKFLESFSESNCYNPAVLGCHFRWSFSGTALSHSNLISQVSWMRILVLVTGQIVIPI